MSSHKSIMREIYRYRTPSPEEFEMGRRVRRVDKFAPLFNRKLRRGIVVDLGCGMGVYTREIRSRMVVGLDFSAEGLRIAVKYCPGPDKVFVLGDMEKLPFKDESVDSFMSFCSVYCLTPGSQKNVFREMYRALRKGGNLMLVEPNAANPFREKSPKNPLRRDNVEKDLLESGFKRADVRYCNYLPWFITRRGGLAYKAFMILERVMELLQLPWSGGLMIYAEK